jgi:radical SAM-linked protein
MSESRQRWRLVFARDEDAQFLSHLDAVKLWERAFRRGSIPVATSEGFSPRPRLVFAAPLQLGMLAEHELADLFLTERLTSHDLRARLAAGMPRGYRILELHDEWVGAPALAPQLVAADYRLNLLGLEHAAAKEGIRMLLAADRLPREKRREDKTVRYDLRPLLMNLRAYEPADVPGELQEGIRNVVLWMRLRHSQNEGSGRAEEVVAALSDGLSGGAGAASAEPSPIEVVHPVRERLWLSAELAT